jgi:hypothetical protein
MTDRGVNEKAVCSEAIGSRFDRSPVRLIFSEADFLAEGAVLVAGTVAGFASISSSRNFSLYQFILPGLRSAANWQRLAESGVVGIEPWDLVQAGELSESQFGGLGRLVRLR